MRLNYTANSFVFACINHEKYQPDLFLLTLQAENFQNTSELYGKQLRFWTYTS